MCLEITTDSIRLFIRVKDGQCAPVCVTLVNIFKRPDTQSSLGAYLILIAFHLIITIHKLRLIAYNRSHNCFFIKSLYSAFQRVKLCNKLSEIGP